MRRNPLHRRILLAVVMTTLLLSGCHQLKNITSSVVNLIGNCDNRGESEYAAVLKLKGITYSQDYNSDVNNLKKGKSVGAIKYTISDDACVGYIMQDGDATILREGTQLYEVQGYASTARLWAGDFLYEATDNPKAKTINDLLDIAGKIKTVRFISGMDGITPLKDFTPEATAKFAEEYPKLKYVPFNKLYKETKSWSGGSYWMQVELKDGSSIQLDYNFIHAAIHPSGYVTPELASLIESQRKRIYSK